MAVLIGTVSSKDLALKNAIVHILAGQSNTIGYVDDRKTGG
jgi:hypothetical protein